MVRRPIIETVRKEKEIHASYAVAHLGKETLDNAYSNFHNNTITLPYY